MQINLLQEKINNVSGKTIHGKTREFLITVSKKFGINSEKKKIIFLWIIFCHLFEEELNEVFYKIIEFIFYKDYCIFDCKYNNYMKIKSKKINMDSLEFLKTNDKKILKNKNNLCHYSSDYFYFSGKNFLIDNDTILSVDNKMSTKTIFKFPYTVSYQIVLEKNLMIFSSGNTIYKFSYENMNPIVEEFIKVAQYPTVNCVNSIVKVDLENILIKLFRGDRVLLNFKNNEKRIIQYGYVGNTIDFMNNNSYKISENKKIKHDARNQRLILSIKKKNIWNSEFSVYCNNLSEIININYNLLTFLIKNKYMKIYKILDDKFMHYNELELDNVVDNILIINKYFFAISSNNIIEIWNFELFKHVATFKGHKSKIIFLKNKTQFELISVDDKNIMKVWNLFDVFTFKWYVF